MSNEDELRKLLNAAQGYNRFMERRVRFLEAELQQHDPAFMLSEKQHNAAKLQEKRAARKVEGDDDLEEMGDDVGTLSRGALVEEVLRIRQIYKASANEMRKMRKEKAVIQSNCQSLSAQVAAQRNKIDSLVEENISLRALLPAHFFEEGRSLTGTIDGDRPNNNSFLDAASGSNIATSALEAGQNLAQKLFAEIQSVLEDIPLTCGAVLPADAASQPVSDRVKQVRSSSARLLYALHSGQPADGEYEDLGGRKRKGDINLRRTEALLTKAEEGAEALRSMVCEIPRAVTSYTSKNRAAVSLVVEGQGSSGAAAVASCRMKAASAASDLRQSKDDFHTLMRNIRQHMITEANALMAGVSGSIGVSLYRPHPQCHRLIAQLEEQGHKLIGIDVLTEGIIKREGGNSLLSPVTEIEHTLKRMATTVEGSDRFDRLDISDIHRMAQESANLTISAASVAEVTGILEGTKLAAQLVLKLVRGELVTHSADERLQHRGTQCNLQQQKLLMTENELAIARLASIRSNWFDAAMAQDRQLPQDTSSNAAAQDCKQGRTSARRSVTPGATSRVSAAEIARLVKQSIQKHKLIVPPNFAPVGGDYRGGEVKYHFGRKIIALHTLAGGSQVAVHVGGGFITFEEYCLKNSLAETRMLDSILATGASSGAASGGSPPGPTRADPSPEPQPAPVAPAPELSPSPRPDERRSRKVVL